MPCYRLNIKWKKEKFSLDCDTNETPESFKAILFSLTGVSPERQRIMMPGGVILGNDNFDGIKLKDGSTLMLMGTVDDIPQNLLSSSVDPIIKIKEEQKQEKLPNGIVNLGNTCYMSATLQLLFSIPELRMSLKVLDQSNLAANENRTLVTSLGFLFQSMKHADKAVVPALFLANLHSAFPQFATVTNTPGQSEAGASVFQQQDANECWTEIIRVLQRVKTNALLIKAAPNVLDSFKGTGGWNPVDRYLTVHLHSTLSCDEGSEPNQETVETFTQISCFINKDVKYLHTGIRNGLDTTLTKHSPTLGKEAEYKKVSRISRLPGFLCVQFVRFFYKEKEQLNAKILKDIKFPLNLDLFEFCTKELQTKLMPGREKMHAEDEAEAMQIKARKTSATINEEKIVNPIDNPDKYEPYWFPDDIGSNNTGCYELHGVLTHQGRSSSSGHYVSWIKRKDKWYKFDDDIVSEVTADDILKLSGGGDWHCAYLLLYSPRRIRISSTKPDNAQVAQLLKD